MPGTCACRARDTALRIRRLLSFDQSLKALLLGLAVVFGALGILGPLGMADARAQGRGEAITHYGVTVTVNKDRSANITETITVNALGQTIKRGILRDIPVRYQSEGGTQVYSNLKILSVRRDGQPDTYVESYEGRYLRLRTGRADYFLPHGQHIYEIRYRVEDAVGFFDEYDEIYWGAIGTEWPFWINNADVTITLPSPARISQFDAYTGRFGVQGDDFRVTRKSDTSITMHATRAFAPREGMSVVVSWQKGVIPPPSSAEQATNWVLDNSPLIIVLLAGLMQFSWLYWAWNRVGRDPEGEAIYPRFETPGDISPALSSYVMGLGSFQKSLQSAFMAALINLAVKGFVSIDETGSKLTVDRERDPNDPGVEKLPSGERALFVKLLGTKPTAVFAEMKHKTMSGIMAAFARAIDEESDQVYFRRNSGYMVPAFLLALVAVVGFVIASIAWAPPFDFPLLEFVLVVILGATVFMLLQLRKLFTGERRLKSMAGVVLPLFVVGFIASVAFSAVDISVTDMDLAQLTTFVNIPAVVVIVAMLAVLVLFTDWMKAPTRLGRQVMDEVEGLKLYMTVTAAEQATHAGAAGMPDLTPQLYEELLPYAVALGIEKQWSKIFEDKVFSQLPEQRAYQPGWYHGRGFDTTGPTVALAAMTSTLGTDLASAMTPPASSSSGFSSGGGFSGGGGGGGGGGGW